MKNTEEYVIKHNEELLWKDILIEKINECEASATSQEVEKKVQKNMYFDSVVESKVIEYLSEDNRVKKEIIFNKHIYPALYKLVENVIINSKLTHIRNERNSLEELKLEVISFLMVKAFPTFDPSRGRAFSYFNKIVINYLVGKLEYEKRYINVNEEDVLNDEEAEGGDNINANNYNKKLLEIYDDEENVFFNREYLTALSNYFSENELNISTNAKELRVINAITDILDGKYMELNISFRTQFLETIHNYCPDLSLFQIKKSLNNIIKHYYIFKNKYINNEI